MEDGIGEKVVLYVHFIGAFLGSLILALSKGWELALICLISLPVTAIIMGIVAFLSTKLSKNELDAYGKAGTIAGALSKKKQTNSSNLTLLQMRF